MALENIDESSSHIGPNGIYLLTSGTPDQEGDLLISYVTEVLCGILDPRIHIVFFNVDEIALMNSLKPVPGAYLSITKTADTLR
ncbi:unnamed protein product [Protopolystoma xenopodis]|uniref:Uncharacterized protein n=1 Tax=Protopolystoma xenopodis TaxID=117903 RepID=A0A3S5AGP7_9PLAT|nr:unnamed protein product [Protopolystoma xenopodis]